jgi:hypothetical protein
MAGILPPATSAQSVGQRMDRIRSLVGTPDRGTTAETADDPPSSVHRALALVAMVSTSHGAHEHGLSQLQVAVSNVSGRTLTPHFTISNGPGVTAFWTATGGPQLGPHETATYLLTAEDQRGYDPGPRGFRFVRALTDAPMTVSTARIPTS